MTHYKSEAKSASSAKMKRMGLHKEHKTPTFDGFNSWDGEPGLDSGNAGKKPITPSRFKRGGKVMDMQGGKAKHHLGKTPRKAAGGPIPHPGQRREPVPLPPRRSPEAEYEAYNPNETTDLGSLHTGKARGGVIGATPAQRKKVVGAMVARKKKEGLPTAAPKGFGVPRDIKAPIGALAPMKKGGRTEKHTDEVQDKKLMHKILKPKAFKAEGGRMHHSDCSCKMCWGGEAKRSKKFDGGGITSLNPMINQQMMANNMRQNMQPMRQPMGQHMGGYGATPQGYAQQHGNPFVNSMFGGGMGQIEFAQKNPQFAQQLLGSSGMGGAGNSGAGMPPQAFQDAYNQFSQQQAATPMNGAQTAQMNPMGNMNGAMGAMTGAAGFGRPQRATGGRAKAGKTNVNIIISPQSGQGQGPLGAGVGMGMPPAPPMMPPVPPMPPAGGGMMPPPGGGMAGAPSLPPQLMAALGGAGGPPMARKSGGRVDTKMPKYQETDYGSGSGLGRLVKRKWPAADGTP